ncbi:polysaccharide deacetylase family protein [Sneathiella marina]|uniref:Polysaccharide deacetylase family protein n=1 Tax=Sneathiella marina TaxID=2950108 RepID=A0ABY4W1X3_9PROT|nr:polysaccharide deacetylase family protein [Sneathiella marina]USG61175.1 polysaccharide deacetylase family protein [Sneathiella marina]
MTSWQDLTAELDLWTSEKRLATFWWRDDDLVAPSPALDRLISLRDHFNIPLALAVIPEAVDSTLTDHVPDCFILQHGFHHHNYADPKEKKSEFSNIRPIVEMEADLQNGQSILSQLFGDQFLPFFVPPWNRIDDKVLQQLPKLGYIGLSRYKQRSKAVPVAGMVEINAHVDPIDWRGSRSSLETDQILTMVLEHLIARRTGRADPREPTGLLTHHLVHDEEVWAQIYQLMSFLCNHSSVRWIPLPAAIALIDEISEDIILPKVEAEPADDNS